MSAKFTDNVKLLNAAATTTVGDWYDISKRERVSVMLLSESVSSGSGIFEIQLSNDGTNAIAMAALQDVQAAASATYVTGKTLSATNTTAGLLIPHNAWGYIRAKVTVATDGKYSAIMEAN